MKYPVIENMIKRDNDELPKYFKFFTVYLLIKNLKNGIKRITRENRQKV